jgi:phosphotriesterase-related protein
LTTRREFLTRTTAAGALAAASALTACVSKVGADRGAAQSPRVGVVQTVLGPLDVGKLGFTLTHEHVANPSAMRAIGRESSVARAVDKLKEARDAGIDTIVDVTTFDIGRDIRFCEEISRKSGMQIVACTGQHLFAPESLNVRTVEEIAGLFVREIERGIEGTEIKAGVIKVAARSEAMTPAEERIFRAAAHASKATGVPIETHTHARRRAGEQQVEIFEAEGVQPARVSLGHSDDTDDASYLVGLAKRGYTLGMDHIFRGAARGEKVTWQRRAEYIQQLVDAGFAERMFLSNDWVLGDAEREALNPDGLLFNTRRTIPYLQETGVTQGAIDMITIANPRRFFARSSR